MNSGNNRLRSKGLGRRLLLRFLVWSEVGVTLIPCWAISSRKEMLTMVSTLVRRIHKSMGLQNLRLSGCYIFLGVSPLGLVAGGSGYARVEDTSLTSMMVTAQCPRFPLQTHAGTPA